VRLAIARPIIREINSDAPHKGVKDLVCVLRVAALYCVHDPGFNLVVTSASFWPGAERQSYLPGLQPLGRRVVLHAFSPHKNIYEQPLRPKQSYIFVANHISYMDTPHDRKNVQATRTSIGKSRDDKDSPIWFYLQECDRNR
jgi:hypothetical protein